MRAILLAAGLGTRLRPLTDHIPKCMVPIDGRPLLDYWLHGLFASGFERVLVNLHHHAGAVRAFLQASPFAARIDMVDEERLLGTAGTMRANADYVDGPFLLAHADNLCITDFRAFAAAHAARPSGTALTMMTFDPPDPTQCGIVALDDRCVVTAFHEKVADPPGRLANAAVYMAEPSVAAFVRNLPQEAPDLSRDVIPHYVGRIFAWHNGDYHIDVGTPPAYAAAQRDIERYHPLMERLGWFDAAAR
jgi:mannose-1-phosphate guanylyltransferase